MRSISGFEDGRRQKNIGTLTDEDSPATLDIEASNARLLETLLSRDWHVG